MQRIIVFQWPSQGPVWETDKVMSMIKGGFKSRQTTGVYKVYFFGLHWGLIVSVVTSQNKH